MKNRKYYIALLLVLALVVGLLSGCSNDNKTEPTAVPEVTEAPADTEAPASQANLTFTTGGPAGTYYAYGTVLANYVTNNSNVAITAVTSNGSADNIEKLNLSMKVAQLGFVQNDVAYYATKGIRLYEGNPVDYFTAIAALYTETVQLVTVDPEIKSVADLKGKNVSIGSQGSGVYFNALDFLAAYDMTEADINPQYLSFGDSAEALKDGKIDAAFVVAGAPTPAVTDLSTSKATYLVALDEEHVKKLQEISSAYAESVIPAGTYDKQDADILTVGVKATIIANSQVTDEQAYTIVKTIFEGKEKINEGHAKGAELDLEYASVCGLPYHPGAAKYFAEKGITVESAK